MRGVSRDVAVPHSGHHDAARAPRDTCVNQIRGQTAVRIQNVDARYALDPAYAEFPLRRMPMSRPAEVANASVAGRTHEPGAWRYERLHVRCTGLGHVTRAVQVVVQNHKRTA